MKDLRIAKGQEMRLSIILAVIDLIANEGIEGLSTQKIAASLRISKSNIFYHFKSVEIILDEVFDTILSAMVQPIVNHPYKTAKDLITFIGQDSLNMNSYARNMTIVIFQFYTLSLHNHKYQQLLLRQKENIIFAITNELVKLTHSDQETCKIVSEMILMSLDGYGLSALLDGNHLHYQKLWELNTNYWCCLLTRNKGDLHD